MKVQKLLRKRNIIIAIVVIIAVLVGWGMFMGKPEAEGDTIVVEQKDLVQEVELSGNVEAASDILVAAESSGIVRSVLVDTGDIVRRGERIVMLDQADVLADIKRAEAGIRAEEARLAQLESETATGVDASDREAVRAQQDLLVENAYEALLNNDLQAYPRYESEYDELAGAPLVSGTYTCDEEGDYIVEVYPTSGADMFRYSGLEFGRQYVSSDHYLSMGECGLYIQFENDYENEGEWIIPIPNVRSASYASALGAYNAAVRNRDVALAQATVKTEEVTIQDVALVQARLTLADAYNRLNDRIITSPINGTIARVNVDPGEFVSTGQEVARIISDGKLEIVAYVPEIDISKLEIGDEAEVTLETYGSDEIFYATIVNIAPSAEVIKAVPSYEIIFVFRETDDRVRAGMTADLTIKTGERTNVVAVPARAIAYIDGEKKVYVVQKDGTEENRTITTGLRSSAGEIEVLSGLSEGERIRINFDR